MGRKKSNAVTIYASHLEDFIWMSYRYCIGRKTIAAYNHADTIATLILKNPNLLSDERRAFMAQDIREQITNVINWKKCIYIDGSHYRKDIFSPLMYALNEYPDRKHTVFHFDANTNEIYKTEKDESLYEFERPDSDYTDLIPWVKLANWLDTSMHKIVTVNFDGVENHIVCYPYPRQDRTSDGTVVYTKAWCSVMDPSISTTRYITDEYIVEVNDVL